MTGEGQAVRRGAEGRGRSGGARPPVGEGGAGGGGRSAARAPRGSGPRRPRGASGHGLPRPRRRPAAAPASRRAPTLFSPWGLRRCGVRRPHSASPSGRPPCKLCPLRERRWGAVTFAASPPPLGGSGEDSGLPGESQGLPEEVGSRGSPGEEGRERPHQSEMERGRQCGVRE